MTNESVFFIDEIPSCKKIRTYAKQKPIQLKRHPLTVEADYEDLFANEKLVNAGTKESNLVGKRTTLKEITNTPKNKQKGANYRKAKRRDGRKRLLKKENQEMDLMKQLIGHTSKSNNDDKGDGAMLNAAETVLDQKPNDVAHNVINCQESLQDQHEDKEQPITSDQDAIISSLISSKQHETTETGFASIAATISPSHSNCFILPTTSTPIQNGKDGEVADFNIDCTPIVHHNTQMEKKDSKVSLLTENNLQDPVHSTDCKGLITCVLVAPVNLVPMPEVNSINTISHIVRIKKLSCVSLDVLIP